MQVQNELAGKGAGTLSNMTRYKKTVIDVLSVHLTFAVCYLPFCVVRVVILIQGLNSSLFLAEALAVCLVKPNSSLNQVLPLEKGIRGAVKETIT